MTISIHATLLNFKMPFLGCFAAISSWGRTGLNGLRNYMRGKFVVWQTVNTVQTSKPAELKEGNERNSEVDVGEKLPRKKEATGRRKIPKDNKEKSNQVKISQRKSKGAAQKSKSTNNVSTSTCQRLHIPNRAQGRRLPPIQTNCTGRPLPPVPNNEKTNRLFAIAGNKNDQTEKIKEIANEDYDDDADVVFPGDTKKAWTVQEAEHDDDDDIMFPGINDARNIPSRPLNLKEKSSLTTTPLTKIDV